MGGGGGLVFGNFADFVGGDFCFVSFCFVFLIPVLFFIPRSSPSSPNPGFTCFYNDRLAPSDFEQAFVKKENGKK